MTLHPLQSSVTVTTKTTILATERHEPSSKMAEVRKPHLGSSTAASPVQRITGRCHQTPLPCHKAQQRIGWARKIPRHARVVQSLRAWRTGNKTPYLGEAVENTSRMLSYGINAIMRRHPFGRPRCGERVQLVLSSPRCLGLELMIDILLFFSLPYFGDT